MHALDPEAAPLTPTGSALGDMLDAVGAALAAAVRRFGLVPAPWQLALVITGGAILALRPQLACTAQADTASGFFDAPGHRPAPPPVKNEQPHLV